jgi:hypothetical protein
MTHSSRPHRIPLVTFTVLVLGLAVTSGAQERPPVVDQMAKTYGLDAFGQIESIRYTFSAEFPGVKVARTWEWEPKTDRVTYEGHDKDDNPVKVTYQRAQLSSQSETVQHEIDPAFVNDQFWLLLPFYVYWDFSADVQDLGMQTLPLGNGSATRVVVKYPPEAGAYSPGDTWELYVGSDNRVEELVYHRGGPLKPSVVIATWAGYKKAGPLLISTEHQGTADGKTLRVFFSDVSVKVTGSDSWMNAQ